MTGQQYERWWPVALAAVSGTLICAFSGLVPVFPAAVAIGTTTLGVVVAGFTATQRNMLLGMRGSRIMKYAAESGRYADVLHYMMHCIWWSLALTVVSLLRLLLGDLMCRSFWVWAAWLFAWSGLTVCVIATLVRNERIMLVITKQYLKKG